MDTGALYGRGMAFPPRVGADGRIAWSQGADNVREGLRVLLLTQPGERVAMQRYGAGLQRFLFEPNTPGTRHAVREAIEQAITRWEPRVSLQSVVVDADADDERTAIATITVRMVATQVVERVTLAVTLSA